MAKRATLEEVINKANDIHNFKYIYSQIKSYKNNKEKVPMICPKHGMFMQSFHNHIVRKARLP